MTVMTIQEARAHANQAGRGSLSSLEQLMRSFANGEVYDVYAGNPTSNLTPAGKGAWCLDTTNNIWYRAKGTANTDWVAIGTHGLTAAELAYLDGITAGTGAASKALVLDSGGRVSIPSVLGVEAGVGITGGSGTVYASSVQRIGGIVKTEILLDITGLNSNVVSDIIGTDGAGAAHLGQLTAAINGTILGGRMTCLEAPTGGEPDIDLFAGDEATGVEDTAITALTNDTAIVTSGGDWTILREVAVTGIPAADQYLYLVGGGGTTNDTYTAGKFLIELLGYDA